MHISDMSRKEVGSYGEKVVSEYLKRRGFRLVDRNVSRKTGEIDIIARKGATLHFIEVKTLLCREFPQGTDMKDRFDPSMNIHAAKVRKVARTAEWYVADISWKGLVAIDAALVWLRVRDGIAKVSYLPQIL